MSYFTFEADDWNAIEGYKTQKGIMMNEVVNTDVSKEAKEGIPEFLKRQNKGEGAPKEGAGQETK